MKTTTPEKEVLYILNMKCGGCASTVENAISSFVKVENIDPAEGKIEYFWPETYSSEERNSIEQKMRSRLRHLGYPPADEDTGKIAGSIARATSYVSCAVGRLSD